ncbi:MAG TPA: pyridoxal-phosphate dependent enzyme [Planctomycetota bacterium]
MELPTTPASIAVLDNLLEAVGNTPLVRLPAAYAPEVRCEILLKVEAANPGGSVKDRVGVAMILGAEARGELLRGGTVVEYTSGNTGVGLCLAAAARGYRVILTMPDRTSAEKVRQLRARGAEIELCPSDAAPGSPGHFVERARRTAAAIPGAWLADQFRNSDNPGAHYRGTAPEIWAQTGGRLDAFVACCGTGGTVAGVGRYLRERDPRIRIVAADPQGSVYAEFWRSGLPGVAGPHAVEGAGGDQVPPVFDAGGIDHYEIVADAEAFGHARRLAAETGLMVGGSSGLALAAALRFAARLPAAARVVVLLPDGGERYLSKLYDDDWMLDRGLLAGARAPRCAADLLRRRMFLFVRPDDSLETARLLLGDGGNRPLPVLAGDGSLLGVVDEAALLGRTAAGARLEDFPVSACLAPPPPCLEAGVPLAETLHALAANEAVLVRSSGAWAGLQRSEVFQSLGRLASPAPASPDPLVSSAPASPAPAASSASRSHDR